jgi:hypothetical protein
MGKTTRTSTYIPTGVVNAVSRRGRGKSARVTGIAVLADELEWQALADENPLFEFKDYEQYLVDIERRMRAAGRAGRQVMVGLLMPDQFETRADAAGIPRDSPKALKEYEKFVADLGPLTREWTGEPIAQVLERLRAHVRAETLQSRALLALTAAAALHEDPNKSAQRAMSQAAHAFLAASDGCGDGQHELRIKVTHPEGDLEYALSYSKCGKVLAFTDDGGEHMVLVLLAIASLAERNGSMTMRSRPQLTIFPPRRRPKDKPPTPPPTTPPNTHAHAHPTDPAYSESLLRGWRLGNALPRPMSEGQLFAFTCTTPSGDPTPPEPGTRFRAAFPLDPGNCECCH